MLIWFGEVCLEDSMEVGTQLGVGEKNNERDIKAGITGGMKKTGKECRKAQGQRYRLRMNSVEP